MPTAARGGSRRPAALLSAARRVDARVSPLELFFDLVFVLALTQCTALMADVPTWQGVAQALLVLSALWWSWVGYAWLTSVVDPEGSLTRVVVFMAMAAFLVAALAVPGAFGQAGLLFATAYLVVRVAHLALFLLASRDDPALRRSVVGLAVSTTVGSGLLFAASAADDGTQAALWVAALLLDVGGPLLAGSDGWRLFPEHFAERHGLVVIIALGESVVAVGAGITPGPGGGLAGSVVAAAAVSMALVAVLWWLYFDTTALDLGERLEQAESGRVRNDLARDAFSYLHLPVIAGIVLVALGLKKTLGGVQDPLSTVPAAALLGGAALFLLAAVALRWRTVRAVALERLGGAVLLLALLPVAQMTAAAVLVAATTGVLVLVVTAERLRAASRSRERDSSAA